MWLLYMWEHCKEELINWNWRESTSDEKNLFGGYKVEENIVRVFGKWQNFLRKLV